ncbi:MAG: thiosulfate oxidation carrier protein SoxY [Candidatus Competibacterales bacterium]
MEHLANRRTLIQGALASGFLAGLVSVGLLTPSRVLAAGSADAFAANNTETALRALYADGTLTESTAIALEAPGIAENGAVVPISVSTPLEGVESITLLVDDNPSPLAAHFELPPRALAEVSTRIRMGQTSSVMAVVKANGRLYTRRRQVQVLVGGCLS